MVSQDPADAPSGLPAVARPAGRPSPAEAQLVAGATLVLACQALVVTLDAAQPGMRDSLPGFLRALIRALMSATPVLLAVACAAHGITRICTHARRGRSPSAEAHEHALTRPRWHP
jgi:hypothetical protein